MNQKRRKDIGNAQRALGQCKAQIEELSQLAADAANEDATPEERAEAQAALKEAVDKLGDAGLSSVVDTISGLKDEEQEYYDNMPEGLQGSERGELASSAVENLEGAEEKVQEAIDGLETIDLSLDGDVESLVGTVIEALDEADGLMDEAAS